MFYNTPFVHAATLTGGQKKRLNKKSSLFLELFVIRTRDPRLKRALLYLLS